MKKNAVIYTSSTGLNNTVKSSRLSADLSTGKTDLAAAVNVDINYTGEISRRKGVTSTIRTEVVAENSMYSEGGDCFYVSGAYLYRLYSDKTRVSLRSGLTPGQRMSYYTLLEKTFYCNGVENGYIVGDASYVWYALPYVGPATTRVFSDPPVGHLVTYFNGRIYIAVDSVICYTEPFAYSWFDKARNFIPVGERLRMLKGVTGGIYAGFGRKVLFLSGKEPADFVVKVVSDSPVVEGTDKYVFGSNVGTGELSDRVVMWTAQDGIFVGLPDGNVKDVTEGKVDFSNGNYGCAVYNNSKYITIIK